MTPLSLAAANGSAVLVETLLKAGADANSAMPQGETVLMTAARAGNPDAVQALLARGADVNAKERRARRDRADVGGGGKPCRGGRGC